jgi:hypothetical protein
MEKVICPCGKEMVNDYWEPDQNETFAIYNCECGISFSGTWVFSLIESEISGEV